MDLETRLRDGLAQLQIVVDDTAVPRLLTFLAELQRWNRSINLTAIEDPLLALEKHLLDSLTLLPLLAGDERILDFGSGAGLPGLPLKIARPGLELWSVDAVRKKINFQKHIGRRLALTDFYPCHGRIEVLAETERRLTGFSFITARAVADLGQLAMLARPLLAADGRLVAMKGPDGATEAAAAEPVLKACGLRVVESRHLVLPFSAAERQLLILQQAI